MSFWRNVSIKRGYRDFREQLGAQQPHRLRFMALAAAVTGSIFLLMFQQEGKGPPRPPKVMYFPSFLPGRTDAEILKENIAATEGRKRAEAEEDARQERIRKLYKTLGDATGLDTEQAYREGTQEREALKREEKARGEEILKGRVTKAN